MRKFKIVRFSYESEFTNNSTIFLLDVPALYPPPTKISKHALAFKRSVTAAGIVYKQRMFLTPERSIMTLLRTDLF